MEPEQNSLRSVAAWLLELLAGGSASNGSLAKGAIKTRIVRSLEAVGNQVTTSFSDVTVAVLYLSRVRQSWHEGP